MDYEAHIRALAQELGATITTMPSGSPGADTKYRVLFLSPNDGSTHWYLSSLHELGHLADQPGPKSSIELLFGTTPRIVEGEARAWEWALEQSQLPFDVAKGDVAFTLGTYLADSFNVWGQDASLAELHGGATERLVRRIGTDVDISSVVSWANGLGMSPGMGDLGSRSWQYTAARLAGAA